MIIIKCLYVEIMNIDDELNNDDNVHERHYGLRSRLEDDINIESNKMIMTMKWLYVVMMNIDNGLDNDDNVQERSHGVRLTPGRWHWEDWRRMGGRTAPGNNSDPWLLQDPLTKFYLSGLIFSGSG